MRKSHVAALAAVLLAGTAPLFAQAGSSHSAAASGSGGGHAAFGEWGVDLSARDLSIQPGDDFWRYANNTWFRNNPIPPAETSWGGFTSLRNDVEQQLRTIVDGAAQASDPVSQRVAAMYASWMDEAGIEARGTAPLRPYLDRINAAQSRDDLVRLFATPGFPSPLGVGITPNPGDPTHYAAGASQGGLGMPNRDYYLNPGAQFDAYRAAYRTYVATIFRLAGYSEPEARADRVIALEHAIAEAHWTPEQSRDVARSINPMTPAQLAALAPEFNWPLWLEGEGLSGVNTIIVRQTTAIQAEGRLFASTPIQTWKDWLAFQFVSRNAEFLPRAFDQANFDFYSHTLRGTEQQRDRWRRGLAVVNRTLGEDVGQLYVARYFPAESQRQMTELVGNLRASLGERLRANQWMDDATRQAAIAKLDAFDPRVGFPVRWIDYSSMHVDSQDLLGNMMRAQQFQHNLELSRLPNPVDRSLWGMTPQTVNAYYSPLTNQITFPAAILQPPFFDPNADPAVNYGAIGAVIGHEMGHGFDDQGSRFDGSGRLRNWWSEQANARFQELVTRLGAQYDTYEPVPGLRIRGRQTMGENIGDLGGIEVAYGAYRRYVAQHGEPPVLNGLTGDQRFFLAYAQVWRSQQRPDALRQQVLTDPHSPAEFRVNGVVRNVDAWYRAFNIQPGNRLYLPPDQRVHIW